jgi:hypothetical protein
LPAYDELVVRELLVNALVHRPYTQRGDIYLNLYPDRATSRLDDAGHAQAAAILSEQLDLALEEPGSHGD